MSAPLLHVKALILLGRVVDTRYLVLFSLFLYVFAASPQLPVIISDSSWSSLVGCHQWPAAGTGHPPVTNNVAPSSSAGGLKQRERERVIPKTVDALEAKTFLGYQEEYT